MAREHAAKPLLGQPAAVEMGGVEKADPACVGPLQGCFGDGFADRLIEIGKGRSADAEPIQ